MANIDRADWHYGGNYPSGMPPENGGTHIGIYLAWVISRGLGSKQLRKLAGHRFEALERREITGRTILFEELDEKFFSTLLSSEGRSFTHEYYESNRYVQDYAEVLGGGLPTLYHVADSWENFDLMAPLLDRRLAAWRESQAR